MAEAEVRGALYLIPRPGEAPEALPFDSLQGLLDLCSANQGAGAFVSVELRGQSRGLPRRLVLDFGQFSAWQE